MKSQGKRLVPRGLCSLEIDGLDYEVELLCKH